MFDHFGNRRGDRRGTLRGMGVSAVVHLLAVAAIAYLGGRGGLFASEPFGDGPDLAMSDGGGGGGGGGGGEYVTFMEVAPVEAVRETVPPEDEEVLVPPTPEPVEPPPAREPEPETPSPAVRPTRPVLGTPSTGTGGGTGAGTGTGEGEGTGPGVGPGEGGGTGGGTGGGIGSGTGPGTGGGAGAIRPPTTDMLLIPPPRPRGVESQDITIRLTIDERGRVREAQLLSSTGNRGYDGQLRRRATEWTFNPARTPDGRPVEAKYDVTLTI
jgi:TonB family protein